MWPSQALKIAEANVSALSCELRPEQMIKIKAFAFFLFKALGLNSFLCTGSLQYILKSHFKGISLPSVGNSNYQVVLNCIFGIDH